MSFSQDDLVVLLFLRHNPHSTSTYIAEGTSHSTRTIETVLQSLEKRGHLLSSGGGTNKRYQLKPATVKLLTSEPVVELTHDQICTIRARLHSRRLWNASRIDTCHDEHYISVSKLCEQTSTSFPVCRSALLQLEKEGVVRRVEPSATPVRPTKSKTTPTTSTTASPSPIANKQRVLYSPWEAWARKTSWILVNLVSETTVLGISGRNYLSHEARAIVEHSKQLPAHPHLVALADRYELMGHDATASFSPSERELLIAIFTDKMTKHLAHDRDHTAGIMRAELVKLKQLGDDQQEVDHNAVLEAAHIIQRAQLEDVSLSVLLNNVPSRSLYSDVVWQQALAKVQL